MKLLLLISPVLLWFVPLFIYRRLRTTAPSQVWRWTGIATGLVVSPASIGVYALYWAAGYLWIFGFPLALVGTFGLVVGTIHGDPIYTLATVLGVIKPGVVVRGMDQLYVAVLSALFWAPIYGAVGWGIDLWRKRRTDVTDTA